MIKTIFSGVLLALSIFSTTATAQSVEPVMLEPAIWVDPDGCQHWVLDLGIEGMMSPHLDRNGRPVCSPIQNVCMAFSGDALFDSGESDLTESAIAALKSYFNGEMSTGQDSFLIVGHTDSVGSDRANVVLSKARAEAVAAIAMATGAIVRIGAQGESSPVATNDTADGRSQNRRVEIICE